jgi:hypothetical protein
MCGVSYLSQPPKDTHTEKAPFLGLDTLNIFGTCSLLFGTKNTQHAEQTRARGRAGAREREREERREEEERNRARRKKEKMFGRRNAKEGEKNNTSSFFSSSSKTTVDEDALVVDESSDAFSKSSNGNARKSKDEGGKTAISSDNNSSSSNKSFKSLLVDAQNSLNKISFPRMNSFQEMKQNWSDYVQKTHDAQMKLLEENALKFSKDLNKMGLKVHMPEVMKTRTEMELDSLRKKEKEEMKRFCYHTAKLVRSEIRLKEAEKERKKAMEEDKLTDEIVGRVNKLKRKVEKERQLRAEADEAFASAYGKLREREQFIENNSFVSSALAEKLLGPGNGSSSDLRDKNGSSPPKKKSASDRNGSAASTTTTAAATVADNNNNNNNVRKLLEKKKELHHRREEEASEASTFSDVLSDDAHANDDNETANTESGNSYNEDEKNDDNENDKSSFITRSILTALLQKRHLTEDKNPQEIIKLERELHQIRCVVALQRIYRREKHLKTIRLKQKRERDAKVRAVLIALFVFACAFFGVKFVGLVVSIIRNVYRRVFVMEPYDKTILYAGKEITYHPPWYVTAGIVDFAPLTHARYSIAMNELDQLAIEKKKNKGKDNNDHDDDISSSISRSNPIDSIELARLRAKYEKNLEVQKASFRSEIEQRQCKRERASSTTTREDDPTTTATKLMEISQSALERSLSLARQRELAAIARLEQKSKQFEREKEKLLAGKGGFAAKLARAFYSSCVFILLFLLLVWSLGNQNHKPFAESAKEKVAFVRRAVSSAFASL